MTGHELYINTVKEKKLFDLNPRDIPHGIREQEFAKLIGIEFEIEAIHCEWRSSVVLDVRHVGSPFTWG